MLPSTDSLLRCVRMRRRLIKALGHGQRRWPRGRDLPRKSEPRVLARETVFGFDTREHARGIHGRPRIAVRYVAACESERLVAALRRAVVQLPQGDEVAELGGAARSDARPLWSEAHGNAVLYVFVICKPFAIVELVGAGEVSGLHLAVFFIDERHDWLTTPEAERVSALLELRISRQARCAGDPRARPLSAADGAAPVENRRAPVGRWRLALARCGGGGRLSLWRHRLRTSGVRRYCVSLRPFEFVKRVLRRA
mmetsp:Transcript_9847/g.31636  ORF Transcript_9847/g.31636 Transcript_9847/m.31636 type:complete len:254 (-) Transcript_9847:37-798(-)